MVKINLESITAARSRFLYESRKFRFRRFGDCLRFSFLGAYYETDSAHKYTQVFTWYCLTSQSRRLQYNNKSYMFLIFTRSLIVLVQNARELYVCVVNCCVAH